MIRSRFLKFNHGSETPVNIAAVWALPEPVDRRSTGRNVAVNAVAYGGCASRLEKGQATRKETFAGTDRQSLWDWIAARTRKREPLWVFTHSGPAQVDHWALWEQIEDGAISFWKTAATTKENGRGNWRGYICSGPDPFYLKFRLHGHSVKVVGVENYARKPLEEFVPYLLEPPHDKPFDDNFPWALSQHCEGVATALHDWAVKLMQSWRENDIGTFQPTAGKLAMCAFRHHVAKSLNSTPRSRSPATSPASKPVACCRLRIHDDDDLKILERRAFFGGEAQAFRVGELKGPFYYLDVRSFYPHLATEYPLPIAARKPFGPENPAWLLAQLDCFGAVADVEICGLWAEYPYRMNIPLKGPYRPLEGDYGGLRGGPGEMVIYPTGCYRTVLCGMELEQALRKGEVRRVFGGCTYIMGNPFGDYFKQWWDARVRAAASGDAPRAELAKMMSNSLLGKFAQRAARWIDVKEMRSPIPWGDWYATADVGAVNGHFRSIGWHTQARQAPAEIDGTFIALPAFVTAYGRVWMRELRSSLPAGSVVLQDTDGMIVDERGMEAITSHPAYMAARMGAITLKGQFETMTVWGPRHYRADDAWVMSGVKGGSLATGPGTYAELLTLYLGAPFAKLSPGQSLKRLQDVSIRPELLGRMVRPDGSTHPVIMGVFE